MSYCTKRAIQEAKQGKILTVKKINIERFPRPYTDRDGNIKYSSDEFVTGTQNAYIRDIVTEMVKGMPP